MKNNIYISETCGLCNGSQNAIDQTLKSLENKRNVVLYKEILHNKNIMKKLESKGVLVKNNLNEINKEDYVIIRAHGEPFSTFNFLDNNKIDYSDCTCPNVKAINLLVKKKSMEGYKIIVIGKYGFSNHIMHPEVEGIIGWCDIHPILIEDESEIENIDLSYDKYFLVVQTTFSSVKAEDYINKIKDIMEVNKKQFDYKCTICNAQKNINIASISLANKVDIMVVIGGKNSSNSTELYKNINSIKLTYFVENKDEVIKLLEENKLNTNQKIGITAGASTLKEDIYEIKDIIENYLFK